MKYYAVKKGLKPGIYESWDECKANVNGFKGAEYKSFAKREDAVNYIQGLDTKDAKNDDIEHKIKNLNEENAIAFVDGSYENSIQKYSYGCIIITKNNTHKHSQSFCDRENIKSRNVAGELAGVKYAVNFCITNNIKKISVYYDYEGIEKWANKRWKANLPLTSEYVEFIENARKYIEIEFYHVKSHTGIKYNEEVDLLAKTALNI